MADQVNRPTTDGAATGKRSRRDILKTGVVLVPTIMTLHAAPAWATTDYTEIAYRYGVNAGKCRNPNFDPNSNAPWKRDEFMPCDEIKRNYGQFHSDPYPDTDTEGQGTGGGTQDIIRF